MSEKKDLFDRLTKVGQQVKRWREDYYGVMKEIERALVQISFKRDEPTGITFIQEVSGGSGSMVATIPSSQDEQDVFGERALSVNPGYDPEVVVYEGHTYVVFWKKGAAND